MVKQAKKCVRCGIQHHNKGTLCHYCQDEINKLGGGLSDRSSMIGYQNKRRRFY